MLPVFPFFLPWLIPYFSPDLIIKGKTAQPGELPYQVSLQTIERGHFCGGALIDKDIIITAAHCVEDKKIADIIVVSGVIQLSDPSAPTRQVSRVIQALINPNYDASVPKYDLAVLQLEVAFSLNSYVNQVPLPPRGYISTGLGKVSGWGATYEGGPNTDKLQEADLSILTEEECKYYLGDDVDETVLCARSGEGKDACQGDSGGPLACGPNFCYLCGIISAGIGCGHSDLPGLYTSVTDFLEWIYSVEDQFHH